MHKILIILSTTMLSLKGTSSHAAALPVHHDWLGTMLVDLLPIAALLFALSFITRPTGITLTQLTSTRLLDLPRLLFGFASTSALVLLGTISVSLIFATGLTGVV